MLSKVQGNTGNGYFSQAVSEYAQGMKPEQDERESFGTVFASECYQEERDKLLDETANSPEEYRGYGADGRWKGDIPNVSFDKMNTDHTGQDEKLKIMNAIPEEIREGAVQKLIGNRNAPYSALADEDGMVTYNGVVFQCDFEKNRLCLGDVSNPDNCLNIPLEKGGCLVVNRDNIDGLIQAIGMFSPADVNRIMQAIAQDAKVQQIELQIEDETSGMQVLKKEGEHESEE